MFSNLGPLEITLIVLALLLLFGAKKIPELARGIGTGMKEFKKSLKEDDTTKADESTKTKDENKA